jgi:AraC-like DNA-binding protein
MHSRLSDRAPLPPDPLSEVLQDLRPSGVSYGHCRLTRPWGVHMPSDRTARLHLVVTGEAWLRTGTFGPTRLGPGDFVLLPTGVAHEMSDMPHGRTTPLAQLPSQEIGDRVFRVAAGGGGSATLMACCSVMFAQPELHPLLELMPPVIHICGAMDDPILPMLLDAMASEVLDQRVGAATILARLADVVITRVIRTWVEGRCGDTSGWLAAIRDPKIGRALAAMHREPARPWSVEDLARVASLSRSTFSERFSVLVGVPPAQYLATWRMHLASNWLRNERLTVAEVSARLGYESEPAFSRAFKRHVGIPPSAWRRAHMGNGSASAPGDEDNARRNVAAHRRS